MEKENQKQKVFELYRSGHSFGEIAKQTGEAKSTVYRWVKEYDEENGTDVPPVPTGFGTDREQNSTDFGTSSQNEMPHRPTVPQNRDEYSLDNNKLAHVEIRKAELEHDYRMAELNFQQEQYRDKRKAEAAIEEMERLRQELVDSNDKIEELQDVKNENQTPLTVNIPQSFISRLVDLLKQYINCNEQDCSLEFIETMDEKVRDLEIEIDDWASDNDIDIENEEIKIVFEKCISDLEETLATFEEKEAEVLTLFFDESWKAEMESWLEMVA